MNSGSPLLPRVVAENLNIEGYTVVPQLEVLTIRDSTFTLQERAFLILTIKMEGLERNWNSPLLL